MIRRRSWSRGARGGGRAGDTSRAGACGLAVRRRPASATLRPRPRRRHPPAAFVARVRCATRSGDPPPAGARAATAGPVATLSFPDRAEARASVTDGTVIIIGGAEDKSATGSS